MEIKAVAGDVTKLDIGAVIVNLFDGVTSPGGATGAVAPALNGAISNIIKEGEIKGKKGELTLIHTLGRITSSRVLVVGLGKREEFDLDAVRYVVGGACRHLLQRGVQKVATIAHGAGIGGLDVEGVGEAIAEGAMQRLYRFDKYLSKKEDTREIEELQIVGADQTKLAALNKGIEKGGILAEAINLCRDMCNEPANYMTPSRIAEIAREVADETSLELQVFDRPQMEELGMGALLGVAQGSNTPPRFIILRHRGDPENESNNLGLVGKGITFDTGGISIKPAPGMGEMKGDMAGGASVIAAMKAIGHLKPRINVTGIVPTTENMPGGSAQRPGDVVKAMNGKSIEVDNTDAEGRLILADALCYARQTGLTRLVDVATLTVQEPLWWPWATPVPAPPPIARGCATRSSARAKRPESASGSFPCTMTTRSRTRATSQTSRTPVDDPPAPSPPPTSPGSSPRTRHGSTWASPAPRAPTRSRGTTQREPRGSPWAPWCAWPRTWPECDSVLSGPVDSPLKGAGKFEGSPHSGECREPKPVPSQPKDSLPGSLRGAPLRN